MGGLFPLTPGPGGLSPSLRGKKPELDKNPIPNAQKASPGATASSWHLWHHLRRFLSLFGGHLGLHGFCSIPNPLSPERLLHPQISPKTTGMWGNPFPAPFPALFPSKKDFFSPKWGFWHFFLSSIPPSPRLCSPQTPHFSSSKTHG